MLHPGRACGSGQSLHTGCAGITVGEAHVLLVGPAGQDRVYLKLICARAWSAGWASVTSAQSWAWRCWSARRHGQVWMGLARVDEAHLVRVRLFAAAVLVLGRGSRVSSLKASGVSCWSRRVQGLPEGGEWASPFSLRKMYGGCRLHVGRARAAAQPRRC